MRLQLVLCIKYKYCFSPKLNFPNKKVGVIIDEGVLSVRKYVKKYHCYCNNSKWTQLLTRLRPGLKLIFETINLSTTSKTPLTILVQCHISIPPENVRKPKVSDVFRGCRNVTLDKNGLTQFVTVVRILGIRVDTFNHCSHYNILRLAPLNIIQSFDNSILEHGDSYIIEVLLHGRKFLDISIKTNILNRIHSSFLFYLSLNFCCFQVLF